jgi:hypothetical protein
VDYTACLGTGVSIGDLNIEPTPLPVNLEQINDDISFMSVRKIIG